MIQIQLKDSEAKLLKLISKVRTDSTGDLVELWQGEALMKLARQIEITKLERIEDITTMFEILYESASEWERQIFTCEEYAEMHASELVAWAYDKLVQRDEKKLDERLLKNSNRAANRARYLPQPIFRFYKVDGEQWRWMFRTELRSNGLLSLIVENLHGVQSEPVALGILVDKNDINNETEDEDYSQINLAMSKMVENGVAVSGNRLGFNMRSPGWGILTKCFPEAADASAYCHGLNAPILPDGYLPNTSVKFSTLKLNGKDLGTDGSGFYNPNHPDMAPIVARYGVVPIQFRLIEPITGLFAKGVVFPNESVTDCAIQLDHNQVKGALKAEHKTYRNNDTNVIVNGCYIGILQAWSKNNYLTGSFEVLENIQKNKRTIEIVETLVSKAMAKLTAKGLDGLAAEVSRKDPVIGLISQLVHAARVQGMDIHTWQVPRVQDAIKDRLSRVLYEISNGAGIKIPSYVVRMDSNVPKGHAVVSGIKPGKKVVGFRIPNILAQGCQNLTTIKPLAHHLVSNRKLISEQTYEEVFNEETGQWDRANSN